MSGTNVHAILEEPPAQDDGARPPVPAGLVTGAVPWVVSARSADGRVAQAARLAAHLAARPELAPGDVAWSLATTRSVFEHRAVMVGTGPQDLTAGLAALAAGEPARIAASGLVASAAAADLRRTVFVFPGQGSQWAGMGAELAGVCPVFAARLAECGRALAPHVDWDLADVITGVPGAPGLETADVVQPVLWAVMVSLAAVWQAAGVTPDAVVGHSQGEIAAATVAGILSLDDAARVVAVRSRALSGLGAVGGMVSVVMPEGRVRELLGRWGESLAVAAVNGPAAIVVSGEPGALAEFEAELSARHVMRWRVPESDFVAHSAGVEGLAEVLAEGLAEISPGPGRAAFYSTALSRWMDGPELDAGYWFANVRQTVRFADAVRVLWDEEFGAFIEVSPHPTLELAVSDTVEDAGGSAPVVSGTLHRESAGAAQVLSVLARAWARGVPVDWAAVVGGGQRADLPTYAFARQRFWPRARTVLAAGGGPGDGAGPAEERFWAAVDGGDVAGLSQVLSVDGGRPFGEVLPVLASWRRRERDRLVTEGWRYRVCWGPVSEPDPARLTGEWLVVVPAGRTGRDVAGACVAALEAGGAAVRVAEVAAAAGREALAGLLGDLGVPVAGVVSLLALDEGPVTGLPVVAAGLAGTLALVQALGDARIDAPLWVLTCGAVAAGPGEVLACPVQQQVWGLGRVASLEYPDRWGGLVDVPPVLDGRAGARLVSVLAGIGEDQVAVRGGGIFARRLSRAPRLRAGQPWVPGGTVLVTGGTGAVGGRVARWVAGRGAPRVVLASRSGPAAAGAAAQAAALSEAGAEVEVIAGDIGDRDQVAGLLARIGA
ncbi:MAG TPA: acyltransferase domain-containing protein, partial [Streptosporangiaceae bacterium]